MTPTLADIPILRDVGAAALKDVEKDARWWSLPAGWPLFGEGEPADALHFVVSGSMGAFRTRTDGRTDFVGHIRAGEPVGEMALVAGEPHSASVHALRDTELLTLERGAFRKLIRRHPALMENLARTMLLRARQTRRRSPRADPRVFALFSTSPSIELAQLARQLKAEIEALGKRCAIVDEAGAGQPSAWFDDLERWNDVVLLTTPIADTAWCKICLRQADRIWILGRSDARPSTPLLPDDPSPARQFQLVDVVLIHPGDDRPAAPPMEWIEGCDAARLFHWRMTRPADAARLARSLAGVSVGLVMSGGGARAYAHIGAVRALREAGMPLDFVGGASMGGVIAACVAMGWNDAEIERRIWEGFVESNPLADYVLPVVAMTSGKRVDQRLRHHFGTARIEELALPFFCVSTNLTSGAVRIHRTGELVGALRGSIALPGILPPRVDGGDVLVDGAVLNNFPVDVMQELHRGPTIGIDVARQQGINAAEFANPPGFFGWVARNGLHAAPPIAGLLMRAATVTIDPWSQRDRADMLITPALDGMELRDWKRFDDAVEAGYRETVAALQTLRGPLKSLAERGGA